MLFNIIRTTFAPLLSLFILIVGHALLNTVVPLQLYADGQSDFFIGLIAGIYFAGIAVASFKTEHFIIRIGHIRAFTVFALALTGLSILMGIFVHPWVWLVIRFFSGFAIAGLFIVIESWLLILGTVNTRGQVLALYMSVFYGAMALGQFFIKILESGSLMLFIIPAVLSAVSIIPLMVSKIGDPIFEEPSNLNLVQLVRKSYMGVVGCLASGLMYGAVFGLLPLFFVKNNIDNSEISLYMAVTIFGGMALQYPIGKLSDMWDKRIVLFGLLIILSVISISIIFVFKFYLVSLVSFFIFGGLIFTLYPVSVSLACESLEKRELVGSTQGLLLVHSAGEMVGPLVTPLFMVFFDSSGLLVYVGVISFMLSLLLLWSFVYMKPQFLHSEHFSAMPPQDTPITSELKKRS